MTRRDELIQIISTLPQSQVDLLLEMVEAFTSPVEQTLLPTTDFVDSAFADQFCNRLRIHHATTAEKFKKKTFEYAFVEASRHGGHDAEITSSATMAGADVVRNGERFSLKTEASANISSDSITISKFSEARWIRECSGPRDFCRETQSRIPRHLDEYDRVVTLRAIDQETSRIRYDLVEIPTDVLRRIEVLTPQDFSEPTVNGSSSADIRDSTGRRLFKLRLDGSVEKVTISGLLIACCVTHASWTVAVVDE